jgi:transposase
MNAVGLDIGKGSIMVCCAAADRQPARWTTTRIVYKANDGWPAQLRSAVPPGAVVALEPTGFHYMQPPVNALEGYATIWQIPTTATEHARIAQVSRTKTDRTDAQALALIATWITQGSVIPGAYPFRSELENAVTALRLLVNDHTRTTRSSVRLQNQVDALAFSLWPAITEKKDTWLRAAHAGYITPQEVRALSSMDESDRRQVQHPDGSRAYPNGQADYHLHKLAARLPDHEGSPAVRSGLSRLLAQIWQLERNLAGLLVSIEDAAQQPPFGEITRRWMTVPNATLYACAALHVATRGRALTYDKNQFRAAVGGQPKRRESGDSVTYDHTKAGYSPSVTALFMWAQRLLTQDARPNPVSDYFDAVTTPHRMPAAVNKLARILWGIARDPEGYKYATPPQ